MSRFLRVFAIIFGLTFAGNAFAAGYMCTNQMNYTSCKAGYVLQGNKCVLSATNYTCATKRTYTTCKAGYYMTTTTSGVTSYNGTPTANNACSECPSGATYCLGGITAPLYRVTLNANGGTGGLSAIYRAATGGGLLYQGSTATSFGTYITKIDSLPTKSGYTFNGYWDDEGNQIFSATGTLLNPSFRTATGEVTLNAQWTAICNTITLDNATYGGKDGTTTLYKLTDSTAWYSEPNCSGTPVTTITKPSKTNATYAGHYTDGGSTAYITSAGALSTSWTVKAATTLHAKYNCNSNWTGAGTTIAGTCTGTTYTITLNDNDGTGGSGTVKQQYSTEWTNSDGTEIPSVTIPTRDGYVFTGYYTATSGGTQRITADGDLPENTTFTADTTLYAQWNLCSCTNGAGATECSAKVINNECKITWSCNSGYYKDTKSATASGEYTATCDSCTENAGASYTASDGEQDGVDTCYRSCTTSDVANSNTVSGKFYHGATAPSSCVAKTCSSNFYLSSGTCTTCGTSYPKHDADAKDATYCWKDCANKTGYTKSGRDYNGATDTCAYAANVHTVTLDDATNGGTGGSATVYQKYETGWSLTNFGTTIPKVTVPTKSNEVFLGYYTEKTGGTQVIGADGTLPANTSYTTTGTTTLYAQFSVCTACSENDSANCELSVENNECKYTTTCKGGYYNITNDGKYNASCSKVGYGWYSADKSNDRTQCTTTDGWTTTTGTETASAYTSCYQTQTPTNCSSGTIKLTASSISDTGEIIYSSPSVTSALSANTNYYVDGTACSACPSGYPNSAGGKIDIKGCYTNVKLDKNGYSGTLISGTGCTVGGTTGTTADTLKVYYNTVCTLPTTSLDQTGYTATTGWAASNTIGASAVTSIAASTTAPTTTTYYARKPSCAQNYYKADPTTCSKCGSNSSTSAGNTATTCTCTSGYTADGTVGGESTSKSGCTAVKTQITLDNASATTAGTTPIYAQYNTNVYLDSARSKAMTTSANGITVPVRKYTVTYKANNGSVSTSSATAQYTFNGYYSTASSDTQYIDANGKITSNGLTAGKALKANGTWNAQWTSASVTLPMPTRTGYTFNGWYDAASGGTKIGNAGATYTPTANVTLHAQWKPNTYSISYTLNGGSFGTNHPTSATFDTEFIVNAPTHAHGTFAGWKITNMDGVEHTYGDQTTNATSIDSTKATVFKNLRATNDTVTFTAIWTCHDGYNVGDNCGANTIYLSWNNGGHGTAPTSPDSCTYGSTFNAPAAMTAEGYTFNKWSVNNKSFSADATINCTSADLGVTSGTATITGTWNANEGIPYAVNHYTKDLGEDTYKLRSTDNYTGITGETLTLEALATSIDGFKYVEGFAGTDKNAPNVTTKPSSGAVELTTILAEGTRVIDLYYDRNTYTITVEAGNGIASVAATGWTNTGTTSMSKVFEYESPIDLASVVTPSRKTGYTGVSYSKTSGSGTLSGTTFTVGAGVATITVAATGISAPTAAITPASTTKVYNYEATTLTAKNNTSYDSNINVYYSFGSSSSSTGSYSYGTASTTATTSVGAASHRGTKYYKVQVYAKDGTLTSSTVTSDAVSVTLNNKTITFDANGGTLNGTSPLYVAYGTASLYTSANGATVGTTPTASKQGYKFNGWYTAASGGSQIYTADGKLNSVDGYTQNGNWVRTTDTTLYAQWATDCNAITLNPNGGASGTTKTLYKKTGDKTWYKNGTCTEAYAAEDYNSVVPSRSNYTFRGFYLKSENATDVFATQTNGVARHLMNNGGYGSTGRDWTINTPVTLYAGWARNCEAGTGANCTLTVGQNTTYSTSCKGAYYNISNGGAYNPSCVTVGVGHYSADGENGRTECPPADSGWTVTSPAGSTYSDCYETQTVSACTEGVLKRVATSADKYDTTATIAEALKAKPGSIVSGQTCSQCTGATYSAGGTATTCSSCDSNYQANTDPGKSLATQCQTECDAGYAVLSENAACVTVTGNKYKTGTALVNYGSVSPTASDVTSGWAAGTIYSCPSSYSISGTAATNHDARTDCTISCPKGTQVATANAACTTPTGSWYAAAHSVSAGSASGSNVKICNSGYSTANTATSTDHDEVADCKIGCSAGYYIPTAGAGCSLCPEGKYCNAISNIAQTSTSAVTGSVNAGYYSTGGGTLATPIANGNGCVGTGKECGLIAAGYYGTAGATTSTGSGMVSGGYYSTGGGTSDKPTANGNGCVGDGNTCGQLSAPYYSNGGSTADGATCVSGQTCGTCDSNYRANTTTGKTAATQCQTKCSAGTWVENSGEACTDVESGYWRAEHYVNYGSTDTREACPAGASGSDGNRDTNQSCYASCSEKTISNGRTTVVKDKVHYNGSSYPACTYNVNCNGGYGADGNGTTNPTCTQCTSGSYSEGGTSVCLECPDYLPEKDMQSGVNLSAICDIYSVNGNGSTSENECRMRCEEYLIDNGNGTITWKWLDSGYQQVAIDVTSCDAGYYVAANDSQACTQCSGAYYCPAGETVRSSCPAAESGWTNGTGDGWDSVTQCFETTKASDASQYCDGGELKKYAIDENNWSTETSASSLTAQAGARVDGTTCTRCEPGTYQTSNNYTGDVCKTTDPGYYVDTYGASTQTQCPAGTYGDTTGLTTEACSGKCESGYYCPKGSVSARAAKCPDADAGWTSTSPSGSGSVAQCYEYKSGAEISEFCTAGEIRRSATNDGSGYNDMISQSTTLVAVAGARVNGNTCVQCSGFEWSEGGSMTSCNACPSVTDGWKSGTGTGWDSFADCYQTKDATSVSEYCYDGQLKQNAATATTWGTATVSKEVTADAGAYISGDGANTTCKLCDAGTYQDTDGSTATTCSACTGTYEYSNNGAAQCETCDTGYQANSTHTGCDPRTFTLSYSCGDGTGSVTGGEYAFGSTVTLADGSGCTPPSDMKFAGWEYDNNKYSSFVWNVADDVEMTATYTANDMFNLLYNIDNGKILDTEYTKSCSNTTTTITLPQNVTRTGYDFGGWSASQCETNCTLVDTSTLTCAKDTTLYAIWTPKQIACAAGQYLNGVECKTCDKGYKCPATSQTYTYNAGIQGRTACVAGTYQDTTGQTTCKPADAGYYVGVDVATSQTECPNWTYQPDTGKASCISCPAVESGYSKLDSAGTGWTSHTQCVEIATTSPANCASGKLQKIPTANASTTWAAATVNSDNPLSAKPNFYVDGTACTRCPQDTYPNSNGGAIDDGQCYATKEKTGVQIDGDVPYGCSAVTEWNSCEPGTCSYFDFKGETGETCVPENCTKKPKTVTASAGYYVNGAACQACSSLGGGMYTTSKDGNSGGAVACSATIDPKYYLENSDDAVATKCTAGYYCSGATLTYPNTGIREQCGKGYYCEAGVSEPTQCPVTAGSQEADKTPSTDESNASSVKACSVGGIWRDDTGVEIESSKIHGGQRCRCFYNDVVKEYYTNCDKCTIVTCDAGYYLNGDACVPVDDGYYSPAITDGTKPTAVDTLTTQQWQCGTGERVNGDKSGCEPIEFTIVYAGNGNTGGAVESHTCKYGSDCAAADNGFVRDGYDFVEWLCAGGMCDGKPVEPGASLKNATTINGAVITLTAQWSQSTTECQAGKYYNGTTHIACPAGYYCPGTGSATLGETGCRMSCSDLGSEHTSDKGATAATECYYESTMACYSPEHDYDPLPYNYTNPLYATDCKGMPNVKYCAYDQSATIPCKQYYGATECVSDSDDIYCPFDTTVSAGVTGPSIYCENGYYRSDNSCLYCRDLKDVNGKSAWIYSSGAWWGAEGMNSGGVVDYGCYFNGCSFDCTYLETEACPEFGTCTVKNTTLSNGIRTYPNGINGENDACELPSGTSCSMAMICADGYTAAYTDKYKEDTYLSNSYAAGTYTTYYKYFTCKPNTYQVVFNDGYLGGSITMADQYFVYSVPQKLNANKFTRTGYTFAGWNTREDGKGTPYQDEQEVNNLTTDAGGAYDLFAQWTPIDYDITYNLDGGDNNAQNPDTYTIEDSIELQNPSKTGYDFGGWFGDSGLTTQVTGITEGTIGNQEFWAKWTPIEYKITYNLDGGDNNAQNPSVYNIKSATITLQQPTKRGYTFLNWTNAVGDVVTEIASGSIGDVALKANWQINTYKITYDLAGGDDNEQKPVEYTIEQTPVTLYQPTKLGYTFIEWTGNNVSDNKIVENAIGDVTVVANWSPNMYTINFNVNADDGTTDADQMECYYDDETCVLEYPAEWINHDFTGWKSEYNKTYNVADVLTGLMTDMANAGDTETTLTATWNQRKLNCNTNVGAGKYYNGTEILPCPAGSHCPGKNEDVNEGSQGCIYDCPAGSYCAASVSAPTVCEAGTYCPAKAKAPLDCPIGQYCPKESASPQTCPNGGATVVAKADGIALCRKVVSGANADQEFGYGTATWDCGYTSGTGNSAKYQTECVVKEVLTCQAGYYYRSDLANNACSVVSDGYYSPAPMASDGAADANSLIAVACPGEIGDNDGIGSIAPRASITDCYTTCALTTDDISNSDTVTPDNERSFYVSGNEYPACSYTVKCATGYTAGTDRTAPECKANEYQVELNTNLGSGNLAANVKCTFDSGACLLPATNVLTRPGYVSANKWCTNADGSGECYEAGKATSANVSPTGVNTKLFAIWEPDVFKIDFDTTGATSDATIAPVYLKYTVGWFSDAAATQSITKLPVLPEKANWVFLGFKLNDVMITDGDGNLATTQNALTVTTDDDTASVVWTEGATECQAGYYYYYDAESGKDGECRPCEKGYWCPKGAYTTNDKTDGLESCPTYQSANGATITGTTDGGTDAKTAESCYSEALDTYVSSTGNATGTQTCYYDADTQRYDADCDDFAVTSCVAGYWYESGTDCTAVGMNYYSDATDMKRYACPDSGKTDTTTAGEIYNCFKTVDYQASYGSGTKVCNYTAKNDDGTANYGTGCRDIKITACQSGYYLENANAIDCVEVGKNYYSVLGDTERHGCPTDAETGLTGVTNTTMAGTAGECYIQNNPFSTTHGSGRQRCDCNSATLKYDMCSGRVFEKCDAGYYWNKSDNTDCVPVGYGFYGPVKDEATGFITASETCPQFDGRQGLTKTETSSDASACYMTEMPCSVSHGSGIKTCGYNTNAKDYSAACTACMLDTCDEKYYINNNQCDICPAGSICDETTRTGFDGVANAKPQLCKALFNGRYPESDAGSTNVAQCFGDCDVLANVTTMVGRDYQGANMTDTCEIQVCDTKYYLANDKSQCTLCPENSICDAMSGSDIDLDGTPDNVPMTCDVLTGGTHKLSGAGSTKIEQCYTTCEDYEILGGMAIRDFDTVQYNNVCTYKGMSETGNPCEIQTIKGYETCIETSCNPDYELIDGRCQRCERANATVYKPNGNCLVAKCQAGFHPDGDQCADNVEICALPNALAASRTWDEKLGAFGVCKITECADGYHISSNSCVPDTEVCDVEHGVGLREWDDVRGKWGECIATSCDAGYTNDVYESDEPNKQCGRCRNAKSVLGQNAVSSYTSGCDIAACLYQGELYNLENNECVPICSMNGYEDETGTMQWNPDTKKCERKCNDGYMPW